MFPRGKEWRVKQVLNNNAWIVKINMSAYFLLGTLPNLSIFGVNEGRCISMPMLRKTFV
jgi:hypothetical protein